MRSTAIPVAADLPPITQLPTTRRAMAPAPDAIHNGPQPRMNAQLVIRMGRRRPSAAADAAARADRGAAQRGLHRLASPNQRHGPRTGFGAVQDEEPPREGGPQRR